LFRFVEQDVMFDPIQIRFLCPVSVILQPQPVADLIKESVFGGSMDHFSSKKTQHYRYIMFIRTIDS